MKIIILVNEPIFKKYMHENVKSWGYNKRTASYEVVNEHDGKIYLSIYNANTVCRIDVEGAEDEKTNIL